MLSVSRFYGDLVLFSFFFCILFCLACSVVDSLLGFWVFLELCGVSLVPSFFYTGDYGVCGFYGSLMTYIIMSGLSSVFMVSGILFDDLYYFVFLGFVVKLGLFPFSFWVYRVFSDSSWSFIFLFSVVMKFPVLFFCFLYSNLSLVLVYGDCLFTIFLCSILIWLFSFNWKYVWGHISLSSVSTLVVSCFCSDTIVCYFIYFYYFFWGVCCVIFFYFLEYEEDYSKYFWVYCLLLLVTPISIPLFYKLGVCYGLTYSSFYLLFMWSVYSFSEQFFLYKNSSGYFYSGVFNDWCK